MSKRVLIATYDCEEGLLAAAQTVRDEGINIIDAYTPYPVHGLDRAMGLAPSRLGWVCGALGLSAAIFMTWFQLWTSAVSWPINIGGKPWDSLPAFAPVIFEAMVLCAGLGTVLVFFLVARLLPGKKANLIVEGVTNDRFALVIEHTDARLDLQEMRQLLIPSNPIAIEERAEHDSPCCSETKDDAQGAVWLTLINAGLLLVLLLLIGANVFLPRNFSRPNWELFPEMKHSPAYSSLSENPVLPDHMTDQAPVPGTIPRGLMPYHYEATDDDAIAASRELTNPFDPEDPAVLARGEHVFEKFCASCHGIGGGGDGLVAMRGFPPPPPFATAESRKMEDGQLFHMLTYGKGNMPAHAGQVTRDDRWKAILHVRQLGDKALAEAADSAETIEVVAPVEATTVLGGPES